MSCSPPERDTGRAEPCATLLPGPCPWGCWLPQAGLSVSRVPQPVCFSICISTRRDKAGSPQHHRDLGGQWVDGRKSQGEEREPQNCKGRFRGNRCVIQVFNNGRKIPAFNLFFAK